MDVFSFDTPKPATAPHVELLIELVPQTSWGANVRSKCPKALWDRLRRMSYKRAGYRCEVCGAEGKLECHEIWAYDDAHAVQKLEGLISLCSRCHEVKHAGRVATLEKAPGIQRVLLHLCSVNGWKLGQAEAHLKEAFRVWHARSTHNWTLDLTWLDSAAPD